MPNRSYSFKEGLAMMAPKDVGIAHTWLPRPAKMRSILAALRPANSSTRYKPKSYR